MNWGTKIAIFYIFFMIVMISMVVNSTNHKYSLVTEAYYETALDYENHMTQVKASQTLTEPLEIQFESDEKKIKLDFPDIGKIDGEVHLYRPSSHFMDQHIPLAINEDGTQEISTESLKSGLWKIKVKWNVGEKNFFDEQTMFVP